jgi:hypothetical protein
VESISPPRVIIKTYDPGLYEKDMFRPGNFMRVRVLVDSIFGRAYLKNSTITIRDNSNSVMVNGALMANVSNITNGYIYEYNYTIPQGGQGIWKMEIIATDVFSRNGNASKKIAVSSIILQIKLVLNSTSDNVYVPGAGETAFSGLTNNEYVSPGHYYAASYSNEALKALVFSGMNPVSILTGKDTSTYNIGINQRFANSMVLLVFSRGNWMQISNRMASIETGDFLSYIEPSFSFGLGKNYPLKVVIGYENIEINKTLTIGRGYNKLVIENVGMMSNKPGIKIDRT